MTFGESSIANESTGTGDRVYSNQGNRDLLALRPEGAREILDVGCGAGDNAEILKRACVDCRVTGITYSIAESRIARPRLDECYVVDIEHTVPEALVPESFDLVLFSHVLEHLREPAAVLARYSELLRPGGVILIAVPNIACWRIRLQLLRGDFEYQTSGHMDDTHLRFFTYFTVASYLLSKSPRLSIDTCGASGSVPLWVMRRVPLLRQAAEAIDRWGVARWPNLFGGQVLLRVVKR